MIINECSLSDQIEDSSLINEVFGNFIQMYKKIKQIDRFHKFWIADGFDLHWNSLSYPLESWLNGNGKQRDLARFFLTNIRKDLQKYQADASVEGRVFNVRCYGAEEAILQNDVLLSLPFNRKWRTDTLQVDFSRLSENELLSSNISLLNLFSLGQISDHIIKKTELLNKFQLYDFDQVWSLRKKLFPNLCFCANVKNDFDQLEKSYLTQVIKKLMELEELAATKPFQFDPKCLCNPSPESPATLKQYKKEHTFQYDEEPVLASWHIRFTGYPGRIYFKPLQDSILICHVGKHLPTVRFHS